MPQRLEGLNFYLKGAEPPEVCARFWVCCPNLGCKGTIGIGQSEPFLIGTEGPNGNINFLTNPFEEWVRRGAAHMVGSGIFACPECGVLFRLTEEVKRELVPNARLYFDLAKRMSLSAPDSRG